MFIEYFLNIKWHPQLKCSETEFNSESAHSDFQAKEQVAFVSIKHQ